MTAYAAKERANETSEGYEPAADCPSELAHPGTVDAADETASMDARD